RRRDWDMGNASRRRIEVPQGLLARVRATGRVERVELFHWPGPDGVDCIRALPAHPRARETYLIAPAAEPTRDDSVIVVVDERGMRPAREGDEVAPYDDAAGKAPRRVELERHGAAALDARILVVGLGSLGSTFTAQMARNGFRNWAGVDPDVVESANIAKSA